MKANNPGGKKPAAALIPVPAFDPDLLPDAFRPWIRDIAERMQCPIDFPAVGAMITLAAVVGRRIGIRPKQRDDWQVVPNLWGLLIGRPGVMKSPAMKEATRPLTRLEIKAKERVRRCDSGTRKPAIGGGGPTKGCRNGVKAVKKGDANPDAIASDSIAEQEPEPVRRRFIVNDPTPEKAQVIMAENPMGVALERDEAQGFMRSLDKAGREDAREFYVESWNGDGGLPVDRIGRGTLDIPACCLSMLATIQPGPLQSYLFDAVNGGRDDDSFMPRFQLAVWPDVSGNWRNSVDRWPNTQARQRAFEVIEGLANLEPLFVDAQQDDHNPVPFLRSAPDAQVPFDAWRGDVERQTTRGGPAGGPRSGLGKVSLPDSVDSSLDPPSRWRVRPGAPLGVGQGGWLGPIPVRPCADHIYGVVPTVENERQSELLDWIQQRGGTVTPRDLAHGMRRFQGRCGRRHETELDALVKAGLGERVSVPPGPRGGRATRVFRLLPSVTVTATPAKPGENNGSGDGDTPRLGGNQSEASRSGGRGGGNRMIGPPDCPRLRCGGAGRYARPWEQAAP